MAKKESPRERLQRDFRAVMAFPEGRRVLQFIFQQCGYDHFLTALNRETMEVNVQATMYNVARRDVWQNIRRNLDPKELPLIENHIERIEKEPETPKESDE